MRLFGGIDTHSAKRTILGRMVTEINGYPRDYILTVNPVLDGSHEIAVGFDHGAQLLLGNAPRGAEGTQAFAER